eukprot:CAMPEP_0170179082 /NCGR_PEP_ID=MMETSP0040_2-20121228/15947_1 /TAXON_ID=641309 /ORGANISM="Lotharella oceanica, Strain CCMP622" /LENGTH=226 /DNA_ID=CAMNT_0010422883 /DNA_START=11 /DNA_END=691 /DNA_ORIENTATION=+
MTSIRDICVKVLEHYHTKIIKRTNYHNKIKKRARANLILERWDIRMTMQEARSRLFPVYKAIRASADTIKSPWLHEQERNLLARRLVAAIIDRRCSMVENRHMRMVLRRFLNKNISQAIHAWDCGTYEVQTLALFAVDSPLLRVWALIFHCPLDDAIESMMPVAAHGLACANALSVSSCVAYDIDANHHMAGHKSLTTCNATTEWKAAELDWGPYFLLRGGKCALQ